MGLGGLVTGIMGATGDYPKTSPPKPGAVTRDYLGLVKGYTQGAPDVYGSEATWKPQYTELGLKDTNLALTGNGSTPGLLNLLSNVAVPGMAESQNFANTLQRLGLAGDLGTVGRAGFDAYQSMNPDRAALMTRLNQQAGEGLDAGASLDPSLAAVTQQSIRGGQAARGLGYGPADVLQESRALTSLGDQLRQERQGFASGVAGLNAQYQDPFTSLFSQQSNAPAAAQTFLGQAQGQTQGSVPTLFPAQQQYDTFNTAYNARAAANIANQNTQTAMLQGFNSFD